MFSLLQQMLSWRAVAAVAAWLVCSNLMQQINQHQPHNSLHHHIISYQIICIFMGKSWKINEDHHVSMTCRFRMRLFWRELAWQVAANATAATLYSQPSTNNRLRPPGKLPPASAWGSAKKWCPISAIGSSHLAFLKGRLRGFASTSRLVSHNIQHRPGFAWDKIIGKAKSMSIEGFLGWLYTTFPRLNLIF